MIRVIGPTAAKEFANCMVSDEGYQGNCAFLEKHGPRWVTDQKAGII